MITKQDWNWEKWHYENNAPITLIKMGLNHALTMCLAILVMSFIFAAINYDDLEKIFYFSSLTLMTTSVFLFLSIIPLILLHGFHYKLFKKILLCNKLEYSVIVAWTIIFSHFFIIYSSIDYLIFNFNLYISAIQSTFLFSSYLFGLILSFSTFQKYFYKKNKPENNKNIWKKFLSKEDKYF